MGLPSDAHALSAVPGGGALVLAQDLLLYHTQVGAQMRWWDPVCSETSDMRRPYRRSLPSELPATC
jgi:hypothetical protein